MTNPLYVEYYSHEGTTCYKIDLPWSNYGKDTLILCKESEGIDMAKTIAVGAIARRISEAVNLPITTPLVTLCDMPGAKQG